VESKPPKSRETNHIADCKPTYPQPRSAILIITSAEVIIGYWLDIELLHRECSRADREGGWTKYLARLDVELCQVTNARGEDGDLFSPLAVVEGRIA